MIKYYLALEHQYRNFFPVNNIIGNLPNDELYDLENIDRFTMNFENETELKRHLLASNLIDINEFNSTLEIYSNDGRMRKVFDGVCYKEDAKYLNPDFLKLILIQQKDNKDLINNIVCKFKDEKSLKETSNAYNIFIQNLFDITKGNNDVLELLNYLNYNELRTIGFYIKNKTKPLEKNITYSLKNN